MVGGQCWLVGASGGYANVPGPGGVGVTPSGRSLVGCKPRGVMTILVFILHRDGRVALKFFFFSSFSSQEQFKSSQGIGREGKLCSVEMRQVTRWP